MCPQGLKEEQVQVTVDDDNVTEQLMMTQNFSLGLANFFFFNLFDLLTHKCL